MTIPHFGQRSAYQMEMAHLVRFLCFENSEDLLGFVFCGFCHGGQVQDRNQLNGCRVHVQISMPLT